MNKKERRLEDVNTRVSKRRGFNGLLETFMRRFHNFAYIVLISPLAVLCCVVLGLAAAPGLYVFDTVKSLAADGPIFLQYFAMGTGFAFGFLTYGLSLVFIVPLVNFLFPFKIRPFRGVWYSIPAIPWFVHNSLTYLVRYTFLEFITPTPLNVLFYKMMGMKIGKGVVINSTNISDPGLITLEDYVTVGGSATIFAHYGQKGYLIISPVTIGKGTNIGLKASIMGGARIGENVLIKPHAVVLPKTEVPNGATV